MILNIFFEPGDISILAKELQLDIPTLDAINIAKDLNNFSSLKQKIYELMEDALIKQIEKYFEEAKA